MLGPYEERHRAAWAEEVKAWGPPSRDEPKDQERWRKARTNLDTAFQSVIQTLNGISDLQKTLKRLQAPDEVDRRIEAYLKGDRI